MAQQTRTEMELFRAGETAPYSGEYCVVDQEGNIQDFDLITLDEGEKFPRLPEESLCYMLNDTCLDEQCDAVESAER